MRKSNVVSLITHFKSTSFPTNTHSLWTNPIPCNIVAKLLQFRHCNSHNLIFLIWMTGLFQERGVISIPSTKLRIRNLRCQPGSPYAHFHQFDSISRLHRQRDTLNLLSWQTTNLSMIVVVVVVICYCWKSAHAFNFIDLPPRLTSVMLFFLSR